MRTRTISAGVLTLALALGGTLLGAGTATAGQPKVVICHATGSDSNPWVSIEVAAPALAAHDGHGDLIPAPVGGCPTPVVPPVDVPVDPPVDPPIDPPVEVPVDVCLNIIGNQSEIPVGMEAGPAAESGPTCVEADLPCPGFDVCPVDVPDEPVEEPEEPTYTAPIMNCGVGTVPGWLNEHGDPTSCVSNNPCPEVAFGETCPVDEPAIEEPEVEPEIEEVTPPADLEITPAVSESTEKVLAYTGTDTLPLGLTAAALLTLGGGLIGLRKTMKEGI